MYTFEFHGPGVADGVPGPGVAVGMPGPTVAVGVPGPGVGMPGPGVGVAVGNTVTTPPTTWLLNPSSDHSPPALRACALT